MTRLKPIRPSTISTCLSTRQGASGIDPLDRLGQSKSNMAQRRPAMDTQAMEPPSCSYPPWVLLEPYTDVDTSGSYSTADPNTLWPPGPPLAIQSASPSASPCLQRNRVCASTFRSVPSLHRVQTMPAALPQTHPSVLRPCPCSHHAPVIWIKTPRVSCGAVRGSLWWHVSRWYGRMMTRPRSM